MLHALQQSVCHVTGDHIPDTLEPVRDKLGEFLGKFQKIEGEFILLDQFQNIMERA